MPTSQPIEQYVPCRIMELPHHQRAQAAARAITVNPANEVSLPAMMPAALATLVDDPGHLSVLTGKWWGADKGVKLTVSFLSKVSNSFKNKVMTCANNWGAPSSKGDSPNIEFVWTQANGQIRIDTDPADGHYSYLGTDILSIPMDQKTMNLALDDDSPDSEFWRVVPHEFGHCLAADTLIDCPRDLSKYPLGIPISDLVGTQPWVYAWKDGQAVIRKASRVWKSKRLADVVRVKLRPGAGRKSRKYLPPLELVGTPDHRVMLADGKTWKRLGDLKPGDRLCSLYRQGNGKRSRIAWTGGERVREHVFVAEQVHGARPDGHDAHHKNENMLDQSPENLEWKPESAHHSDHMKTRVDSPETSAKRSAAMRRRVYSDETRAKMSASAQNRPPISEETRAKISAGAAGRPQSPDQLAKKAEAMKQFYAAGNRSGMFGKKASEETRQKQSESMKASHAKRKSEVNNHTVVSVERTVSQDVYDMTVPGADSFVANGVVVHNSAGFPHEQQLPGIVARIDVAKAIAWGAAYLGWNEQTVRQQILTPLSTSSFRMTAQADVNGVMMYALPASIMKDGIAIPGGVGIDDIDRQYAVTLYPRAKSPVTSPPSDSKRRIVIEITGDVKDVQLIQGA